MELWRNGRPVTQLGRRYTLIRPLGHGGMADVYLVRDEQNKREVAAKIMIPDVSDQGRAQRFLREGEIAFSLHHQHIIGVYDYGDRVQTKSSNDSGSMGGDELTIPYIIMEYVKGGSLKDWLEQRVSEWGGGCSLDESMAIFEQLCAAVQYLHRENKKHRDIKPANILFRKHPQDGGQFEVVLSDFGLAVADNDTLSQPHAGTIVYMAPEQLQGDPRKASDVFSLGVVLYQLCTGHLPFQMRDITFPLRPPRRPTLLNPDLPSVLDNVILCSLSHEPSLRFASASHFWQSVDSAVRQMLPSPRSQADAIDNHLSNRAQSAPLLLPALRETIPPKSPTTPSRSPTRPTDPRPILLGAVPSIPSNIGKPTKVLPLSPTAPPPEPVTLPSSTRNRDTGKGVVAGEASTNHATRTPSAPVRSPGTTSKTPSVPAQPKNASKTSVVSLDPADARNTVTPADSVAAISTGWPPPGVASPRRTSPANRGRRRLVALVILVLLTLGCVAVWASSNLWVFIPLVPAPTTITITPASKTVQDTYVMQGITNNANSNNFQVTVRPLTSTQSATMIATATGQGKTSPIQATGTLTFKNAAASFDLKADTHFPAPNGVIVANDQFVTIPAGNVMAGTFGSITVNAHAVTQGAAGNMSSGAFTNQPCCRADSTIIITTSSAFTGGTDPQPYTFLQESDVTNAVANVQPNMAILQSNAQNDLKGQLKSGEQLLDDITCADPKTVPDVVVGDQGLANAVTSTKVTVSVICNTEAYDENAVKVISLHALERQVSKIPPLGTGYVLAGHVVMMIRSPLAQGNGSFTFAVSAMGVWYYRWTTKNLQTLLNHIKGKSVKDAQDILNHYAGISQAIIAISSGGTALPGNVSQITLNIKAVKGL